MSQLSSSQDQPLFSMFRRVETGGWAARSSESPTTGDRREALTEIFLQELYDHVAGPIAEYFTNVEEEITSLTSLAKSLGVTIEDPEALRQQIDRDSNRIVWRQAARVSVLHLLDWLVLKHANHSIEPPRWAKKTIDETVDVARFQRLTGLPREGTVPAVETTAHAVSTWPKLVQGLPLLYLGKYVTLSAVPEKQVSAAVSDKPPIAFVPETGCIGTHEGRRFIEGAQVRIYPLLRRLYYSVSATELELTPPSDDPALSAGYSGQVEIATEGNPGQRRCVLVLQSSDAEPVRLSVPSDRAQQVAGGLVLS